MRTLLAVLVLLVAIPAVSDAAITLEETQA